MTLAAEISGQRFHKLLVKRRNGSTPYGQSLWLCECDCGNEKTVPWPSLKTSRVKSCGCDWKRNFGTTRICASCKREKPNKEFGRGNSGGGLNAYCGSCKSMKSLARYHANPAPTLERHKRNRTKLRGEVLSAYGDKCACCGESQKLFLAIDHINNDGAAHRKKVGKSDVFYNWLKANNYPADFQILCCNCNWGKYVNGGTCPHQSGKNG